MMDIDELLFHHHRVELLKSFFDGLDIERNAAEYIISYNNFDNSPNDNVSLLCKDAAQSILLRKDENENFEANSESILPQLPSGDMTAEFLMGLRSVGIEPTNHPWVDSIQSVEEEGMVHGVIPTPQENIDRHYEDIHPFDSKIHPIWEKNSVTDNPQMIEMLRGYYLPQEGKEESLSGIDHKDELLYHKSLVEKGSPIVHDIEKTGWKEGEEDSQYSFPFGGNITMPKGIIGTPETFYRRNFNNWKKQNPHHEDELMSEGVKGKELELELRNIHFNEAVDKWISEDIKYHGGEAHAVGLGDFGYNHGIEWLEPEERTVVYRHMKDKGSLDEKHQLIELPNGENIPVGFIDNNFDNRGVPEFNWWVRPTSNHGPNIDYKLEDNETDFTTGKNRFIQLGLARAANTLPIFNLTNEEGKIYPATFLDVVKNELLNHPGREKIDTKEGDEEGKYKKEDMVENLPRFDFHTRWGKEKGVSEGSYSHDWGNIKEASFNHYVQHDGKVDPLKTLLSEEDLYYLAGYHPHTKEHISEHPLYGDIEEPIMPKEDIHKLLKEATKHSSIAEKAKDIRNDLAWQRAAFGPNPSKDKPEFWRNNEDDYTTGKGSYWWKPYMNKGGLGRAPNTFYEFKHFTQMDKDGNSPLGGLDDSGKLIPNKNTVSTYGSILPHIPPFSMDELIRMSDKTEYGDFLKNRLPLIHSNDYHKNPFDVTQHQHGQDGRLIHQAPTIKNNHTHHTSTIAPRYARDVMDTTGQERSLRFLDRAGLDASLIGSPFYTNPFTKEQTPYGSQPSDLHGYKSAVNDHLITTLLGRLYPPETPQDVALHTKNSLISSGSSVSTGSSLNDFLEFIDWDEYAKPNLNRMKDRVTSTTSERDERNAINAVVKYLGHRSPHAIAQYLKEGDFSHHSDNEVDMTAIKNLMKNKDEITPTEVNKIIQRGAEVVPLPEETEAQNRLENIYDKLHGQMPNKPGIWNTLSEEEKNDWNMITNQLQQQLAQLQSESQQKGLTKKGNFWKENVKQIQRKLKGDVDAITQAAIMLKPMVEAHQPDAFDPLDKMKFLHNTSQLMRMGNRWLLTGNHDSHGLSTHGYGIDKEIKEAPNKAIGEGHVHSDYANIVAKHGIPIDNTMDVPKILSLLGLDQTPQHKEHARKLLNQVEVTNKPLMAMTVHQLLTNGATDKIHTGTGKKADITHLHNQDMHDTLKEGQLESEKVSDWKTNAMHSLPRAVVSQFKQQQFHENLENHGLGHIHSNINEIKGKGFKDVTKKTKNHLDSIITLDPSVQDEEGMIENIPSVNNVVEQARWGNRPISHPNPNAESTVWDLFDSGRMDWGYDGKPTFGIEFVNGKPVIGSHVEPTLLHSIPNKILKSIHGGKVVDDILTLPGISAKQPHHRRMKQGVIQADEPMNIATAEITDYLQSLLNPDVLLLKKNDWLPPIRPMHRIFEYKDINLLRGFSGSWIVSTWYDGKRIVIIRKDDDITYFNEQGKKMGIPKSIKESVEKINDKSYTVDGILAKDGLYIIDIMNYDDSNVADMNTNERLRILRGQFESHDNVFIPGPYNTKITDDEGLKDALSSFDEDKILIRDAKSTYMRGETRHPKWLLMRKERTLNFIILDRRGKGPYTYQLGAGPIVSEEGLGNRAVEKDGKIFMDVGTIRNVQKPFEEGIIVEAKISGVSKRNRAGREIYDVQISSILGEGEGEGIASTESLALFTKSYAPILSPHNIEIEDLILKINLEDVDNIYYPIKEWDNRWYLGTPSSDLGDLSNSSYSIKLAESLKPFWNPLVTLMLKGYVGIEDTKKFEDEHEDDEIEEESAGIIDRKDKNMLLKPNMVKALKIALRVLDVIAKERTTWSGPKGLGIDFGTPMESPRGPTKLRDNSTLPDYDMRPRPGEDEEKPYRSEKKNKQKLLHTKIDSNGDESIVFEMKDNQPTITLG